MFSQTQNTQKCPVCNCTNFYKESGIFFCAQCQTQNEDVIEKVHEHDFDPNTQYKKKTIKKTKVKETDIVGWTSWELYNYVLIGLTNELIEINSANELIKIDPGIKLTILQLWTFYLTNLEVAFTSKTKKCIPRMARRFHKKDAHIIYGKIQLYRKKRKRKRKSGSNTSASSAMSSFPMSSDHSVSTKEIRKHTSILASEQSSSKNNTDSDTDGLSSLNLSLHSLKSSISETSSTAVRLRYNKKARLESKKMKQLSKKVPLAKRKHYKKSHVTTQYAAGPDVVTPLKLWSIVYLALRIHNHDIHVSDMLRFSREGHLSYYRLDHLLPAEITLKKIDVNLLTQNTDITHKGLRKTAASMANFLLVTKIGKPDFLGLIKRYCEDLVLPRGVCMYAQKIFLSHPSEMQFKLNKSSFIPNYEGRAMAYIIVTLKILYGLDDITEKEISRVVEKINRIANEKEIETSKLFSFCEWQNYIECRKNILTKIHNSSKIKYDPDCVGASHLYLRTMGLMKSKREDSNDVESLKNGINQNLIESLHQCLDKLSTNLMPMKEMEIFPPSLTPSHSYIDQLLNNSRYVLPSILCKKFSDLKIGYMTRPDAMVELSAQCGIDLEIVDQSLQYFEKIVPPFEQPRMPGKPELNKEVKTSTSRKVVPKIYENLLDYSHRNRMCKLKVNFKNFKHFLSVSDKEIDFDETLDLQDDKEDTFDQVLPNGRLNINDDSDSEDEKNLNQLEMNGIVWTDNSCLLNKEFTDKYNIKLYNHEVNSLLNAPTLKEKLIPCRDKNTGKFIKISSENKQKKNKRKGIRSVSHKFEKDDQSSDDEFLQIANSKKKLIIEQNENISSDEKESENEVLEVLEDHNSQIDPFNLDSDVSILEDEPLKNKKNPQNRSTFDYEIIARPYKDYWMYHCIFSRVKSKNFEFFEKELPENFLWLLNECASTIEMTTEDLYEEVCLLEAYLFLINSKKSKSDLDYNFHNCSSKLFTTNILNKW